ncbi:MAG: DNA alkylation repair protein [Chloroflexi bacterium]|nr:DNA alkylation repair protein [Chloroflexota bacterium]
MTERQGYTEDFGAQTAEILAERIHAVHPAFRARAYVDEVAESVAELGLKARVRVMAAALRRHLPPSYEDALAILLASLGPELADHEGMFTHGWYLMPVARFVEDYGLDHFDQSMHALREITRRHTSEYAIRPYLARYPEQTLSYLRKWVHDPSPHVRRLVSEGTRSRLPWASRLPAFVRAPLPVIELLDALTDDPSAFVRKSVANNLNDISKDHPELVLATASRWLAQSPSERTAWIVRHGLRTLIKAGDERALALVGATGGDQVQFRKLVLHPRSIRIGGTVSFAFELANTDTRKHALVVDYLIHFARPQGRSNAQAFKLASVVLAPAETRQIRKDHPLKPVRVRRYHLGTHRLEIRVNGAVVGSADFELLGGQETPASSPLEAAQPSRATSNDTDE